MKRLGSRLLQRLNGLARSRWALRAEFERMLTAAHKAGDIKVVYDIGAHKGRWSTYVKALLPRTRPILFEANAIHAADLARSGFTYHICALSRPGVQTAPFYSLHDDAGSSGGSFYKEATPQYADVRASTLAIKTLADVVAAEGLPLPDLVKIDTQGSELDVIEGGRNVIANAAYLLVEIPLVEYNRGAPATGEYFSCLARLGFYPLLLVEQHHYDRVLIQADFLFAAQSRLHSRIPLSSSSEP
jgi:FkbM family methyltransferase